MIIETVKSDVVTNKGTGLSFNSVASALKINSIEGKSVQNGTPTFDAKADINNSIVQTVKVSNKNLEYNSATFEGWNVWNWDGTLTGEIYNGGKVIRYSAEWQFRYPPSRLFKAGTYTVSFDARVKNNGNALVHSQSLGVSKEITISASSNFNRYSYTFTLTEDKKGWVTVLIPSGSTVGELYVANIQVEYNSVATPYEAYKENTFTLSAPVTLRNKDLIREQGDVLRKRTKYVINGSENWVKNDASSTTNYLYYCYLPNTVPKCASPSRTMCDRVNVKTSTPISERGICIVPYTNGTLIYLNLDGVMTTNTGTFLKELLAANNITIEYELATPVFEPLPDADQNLFNSLRSYDGVTVITTDSTVEPELCVTNAVSLTGAYVLESDRALGGCYFKREGDKFYIGYDDGTSVAEMEV